MPTTLPPPNFPTTPRRRGQQQVLTILGSGKNNNKNNNNNPRYTPYQEGARTAVERLCQLLRQADDVVVVEPQQQHHEIPRELVKRLVVQLLPPSSKLRSRILWALSGVLSNCVVLLARTLFHAIHHHHNHHRRRHRRTNRSAHIPGFFLKDVGDGGIGTGGGGGGGVATASTSCVPPPRSAGHQLFRHEYGLLIGREDKDSVTVVHEAREESLREGGGGGDDDDDNNNNNNVHSTTGRQQLVDSVWNQLSSESKRQYERQAAAVAAAARTSFSHQKHDDRFVGPTPQGVGTTTLSLSAVSVESGLDSSSASASSSSDLDDGAGTAPENLLEEHDVWCRLVESVQLEVVAKGPHLLGNKPFRLYRLPHNVSSRIYDTLWLRKTIEDEFRNLFEGKGEFSKCRSALSSCRVYTAQACSNILWLQLNVGQSQHDFTRGRFRPAGKKRAAPWAEYRAVLRCDGHHMAVSSTGPAASARLTQLVVASLENAIACDNGNPRGERGIHGTIRTHGAVGQSGCCKLTSLVHCSKIRFLSAAGHVLRGPTSDAAVDKQTFGQSVPHPDIAEICHGPGVTLGIDRHRLPPPEKASPPTEGPSYHSSSDALCQ